MCDCELEAEVEAPCQTAFSMVSLITRANSFSIVSAGTMTPPHGLYLSEGARERSSHGVLNLGDSAPPTSASPPPPPPTLSLR